MYEIYSNNQLIYRPEEREMVLLSARLSLQINNAGSFVFSMPATHPMYDALEKFKSVITVKSDNEIIFCGRIIEENLDMFKNKTIYCEGELAILNDSIQRPSENHDITVRQFLELLINNHNSQVEASKQFTVGAVSVTDSNNSLYRYTNYENTLTAIKEKLVDKLGGYIVVRYADNKRYIDYLANMPDTCSQTIQFGENLLDYSSNVNASDIATRLIPLGARLEDSQYTAIDERLTIKSVNNNKDYVQSDQAIAKYGIITKIQKWDDVNVASTLKQKGQEYLESIQWENMILNVSAIDMHLLNPEIEEIHVGDDILCVSEVHGLRKFFPVQKMEIDLLNPANNQIQLGAKGDVSISAKSNTATYVAEEANDFPVSSVLKSAKDNATALIRMATNGYIVLHMNQSGNPDELLIMDTPDIATARKVWRWNVNGLGYSNTGYNGTYGLAMTMDGAIVADRITSGTMSADRINGGTIDATKVSVTNLNASNITSGTMSAGRITSGTMSADRISGGTIDANNVTINNLNASKITSGTMSADRISGGTIDANNVTINNLNASKITSGTMSADKISGGTIDANKVTVSNLNASNIKTGTLSGVSIESNNAKITGGSINIETSYEEEDKISLSYNTRKADLSPKNIEFSYDDAHAVLQFDGLYVAPTGSSSFPTIISYDMVSSPVYAVYKNGSYSYGASGTFTDRNGRTVTVSGGIITNIS